MAMLVWFTKAFKICLINLNNSLNNIYKLKA